jgi:hypothetical protein
MSPAERYHAEVAKYRTLLDKPHSPAEALELRGLEQTYRTLADNEEWLTRNADKIVQRSQDKAPEDDMAPSKER